MPLFEKKCLVLLHCSPPLLSLLRTDETVGTSHFSRGISKYTQMREHAGGIYPLSTSPTPVEKESVALMPLVEGPGSISEGESSRLFFLLMKP